MTSNKDFFIIVFLEYILFYYQFRKEKAPTQKLISLQQGRKNPNIEEAIALNGDNTAEDMHYERYNIQVHDFVQKLPGVTSKNIARIMNRGKSLDHLITLNQVCWCVSK